MYIEFGRNTFKYFFIVTIETKIIVCIERVIEKYTDTKKILNYLAPFTTFSLSALCLLGQSASERITARVEVLALRYRAAVTLFALIQTTIATLTMYNQLKKNIYK